MTQLIGTKANQVPVHSMLGGMAYMNREEAQLKTSYRQCEDVSVASGTHTFDPSNGDMQQVTATGNFTIAFSNFVPGRVCTMIIDAVNWGDYTVTHPAGVLYASSVVPEYTSGGTDRLMVIKDKDDVYSMFIIGKAIGAA